MWIGSILLACEKQLYMFDRLFELINRLGMAGLAALSGFFTQYGVFALIGASILKGLLIFYIIPAEAVTPAYVLLFADTPWDVVGISFIAATAILAGNSVIYLFARRLGESFVLYKKFRNRKQWQWVDWMFRRHGRVSMFLLRLVPFIGGWATIPAALVRFRVRDFLLFSFLGFWAYEALLGFAAYYGVRMGTIIRFETLAPIIHFLQSLI